MPRFSDYRFGFADAETEFKRSPELIEEAYYDAFDAVKRVMEDFPFLVIGRKGTGKTAISARIRVLSSKDSLIFCKHISLANFEFNSFARMGSSDLKGGVRFTAPWRLMLLLQVYEELNQKELVINSHEFYKVCKSLQQYGLISNGSISRVVRTVSRNGFRIGFSDVSLDLGEVESQVMLSEPSDIANILFDHLTRISMGKSRLVIVVDGLDDSLRGNQRQISIVSGLIRAAAALNDEFHEVGVPVKFVVMVRPEVLNLCQDSDPDLNKVYRDSSLELRWYRDVRNPLNSDLMQLLKLRLATGGPLLSDEPWYSIFPATVDGKDSWQYVLDHTLHRPRDILQFMIECQRLYPNHERLTATETKAALTNYSDTYLLPEMKNELVGFLTDNTIRLLPGVLARMKSREFTSSLWLEACRDSGIEENPRTVLEQLYEAGYVGQVSYRDGKTYVNFKYRDSHIPINFSETFLLHRGLWKALNIV